MVATLSSALLLPWTGQLLDRIDLKIYTTCVVLGLFLACISISLSHTVWMLTASVFLLRHFGQGLTSHVSVTSMARYMGKDRGKSIAIASTGYSVGEATLPVLAVLLISIVGWRQTFVWAAVAVLICIPVAIRLLKNHHIRQSRFLEQDQNSDPETEAGGISKTRRQMLKEARFYLLAPAVFTPAFMVTGLFFHHVTLADAKGWSDLWVTGNYWLYAVTTILVSLSFGPLIDRFSAIRVVPWFLTPLILAMLLLVPVTHSYWVIPYMIMLGINTGIHFTTFTAIWPELYGTRYLGEIKSMVNALMVFSSALGPVTIGALLDRGYSFEQIFMIFSVWCGVVTVLLFMALKPRKVT